jgi:large subunit ribosomal protein L25
MQTFKVEGAIREERGKNAARRTRRTGLIPATLYGAHKDAVSLSVNAKQIARILRSETGHNTIFTVQVTGGREESAMVKDWQVDPVSGSLLHVDLYRVAMDVRMRVKVPVHTFGEPQGVKLQGGIFEMVTREVEVECLPGDIPEEFKMDVSGLMIGTQLRASDLPLDPNKVKLLTDPQRVLAHVVVLKKEEEPAPEAAVATETAPAEPEVIKKGKKEEEGEGEAEGGAAAPAAKAEKAEKPEKKGKEK